MSETKSASGDGWRSIGRTDVILAVALLVLLLPTTFLALVQGDRPVDAPILVALAVLFAALHALSLLAIRLPLAAFAAASAVMLALAVLPGSDGIPAAMYPSSIAYLLCLAQVVIQRSRVLGFAALGIGAAGAVLITLLPMPALGPQVRWGLLVGLVALVSVAWAIGMLQRLRSQQADDRERARVQDTITAERLRINRDLHDVVAHSMTVMIAQAEVARADVRDDPEASAHAMSVVIETGREALRGMRGIVGAGADAPREPVPDVDTISADVEDVRSVETAATFVEEGVRGTLDPAARIALHHAVREALTNAIRHTAPPRRIDVRRQWLPGQVVTTVHDDGGAGGGGGVGSGAGAAADAVAESPGVGIGLIGMAERVRSAGGVASAGRVEPSGWMVRIDLPLAGAAPADAGSIG